ncbi:MAG: hypothetical protein R6V02_08555 [Candidatus Aminicenantes bacterium]
MKIKTETQLKVTTPNEPGILGRVLGTLANAGINLKALNAISNDNNGYFHLLTSDNTKAEKCLIALGYDVKSDSVLTVLTEDRIGAGAEIGALLGNAVLDVEYCYGSSSGVGKVLLVFKTNNNKKAMDTLS